MDKYARIIHAVYNSIWAIDPGTMAVILDLLEFRAQGGILDQHVIAERLELAAAANGPRANKERQKAADAVAVIPMYGVISPRVDMMGDTSGGTSVEGLRSQFRAALKDPEIGAILFDVDSPGGNVEGIEELAAEIRDARGIKPMTAIANYTAASAAYWLAAQADEVVMTPSGTVGSIGVIAPHQDISKMLEKQGVKTTLITHGKYKAEGNKFEPLSDEAKEEMQARVDAMGKIMEDSIAAGRGVPLKTVQSQFGSGRVFDSQKALKSGLVDSVATYDATLARMSRSLAVNSSSSAPAAARNFSFSGSAHYDPNYTTPFTVATIEGYASPRSLADLVAELPFAERLSLVAAEVEAIAGHAGARAKMRAEEGRALSSETRDQLRGLLSLRNVLDEIEAMVDQPQPVTVGHDLELLMTAYEGGYPTVGLSERIMKQ